MATELKLDYSLSTPKERTELVKQIIDNSPKNKLTKKYLEILGDYILAAMPKDERRQKKILTDNRLVTVNRHETSFEGLISKLENGEDGIYSMISTNRNQFITPQQTITEEDIAEIPELKRLRGVIENLEKQEKNAVGKNKYLLKKQIIELRQQQYIIKNAFNQPVRLQKNSFAIDNVQYDEKLYITEEDDVAAESGYLTLTNPQHISLLLCNYSNLKEDSYESFNNDMKYILEDLEQLVDETLEKDFPLYYDLLIYKIDGLQNIEIQKKLQETYGIKHSVEYISSLWRNKIPKMIAEKAKEKYLLWHYSSQAVGKWKKCSRCGQIKLANNRFFSKNKSSKDGFYSICKECRNKKTLQKKG